MILHIRADCVQVGDEIPTGERHPFNWARVTAVSTSETGTSTIIETLGWSTWKHPAEGVTVRRLWHTVSHQDLQRLHSEAGAAEGLLKEALALEGGQGEWTGRVRTKPD